MKTLARRTNRTVYQELDLIYLTMIKEKRAEHRKIGIYFQKQSISCHVYPRVSSLPARTNFFLPISNSHITPLKISRPASNFLTRSSRNLRFAWAVIGSAAIASISSSVILVTTSGEKISSRPRTICLSTT